MAQDGYPGIPENWQAALHKLPVSGIQTVPVVDGGQSMAPTMSMSMSTPLEGVRGEKTAAQQDFSSQGSSSKSQQAEFSLATPPAMQVPQQSALPPLAQPSPPPQPSAQYVPSSSSSGGSLLGGASTAGSTIIALLGKIVDSLEDISDKIEEQSKESSSSGPGNATSSGMANKRNIEPAGIPHPKIRRGASPSVATV